MWQSTDCALWETVAVCLLRLLAPSATAGWTEVALAAASLLRDRLTQLALKLYGALVLQATWLTVKEKRRGRVLLGEGGRLAADAVVYTVSGDQTGV